MTPYAVITGRRSAARIHTYREASQAIRALIDQRGIDTGNNGASWFYDVPARGYIVDDDGNTIARVSYNGRVWDNDGNEIHLTH